VFELNNKFFEFSGDGRFTWFVEGRSGMIPEMGDSVFPGIEDGLGGDEGEEGRSEREGGEEGVDSEAFMGQEGMTDMVLFEVPAEILIFDKEEG
jgi:hypothetical protein